MRIGLRAAFAGFAALAVLGCAERKSEPAETWVATWAAAADSPGPALDNQTLRQVVRVSVGGRQVRIRLSNLFGDAPLTIGAAHVAQHGEAGAIDKASGKPVTFGGKASVTIAKGEDMLSDAVDLD